MPDDFQAKIDSLVHETRGHVAVPSDACVIQSLATKVLLARKQADAANRVRVLLTEYERDVLTPRHLVFTGLLAEIASVVRSQS